MLEANDPDVIFAEWLGERLRRVALGATAALLTARAFWPSEPDLRADAGGGLLWVLALMVVAGVALAGAIVGGQFHFRWSWADAGVIVLVSLAGLSAAHAVDRRLGFNLAWEWVGFAVAYLLVRNLPRTRGESAALLGALAATAVAVSVYGLYQIGVELPEIQHKYLTDPVYRARALQAVGIVPGTAAQVHFENRLLHSNEPYSTFALANSLAGFLVGPLVVMLAIVWDNLTRREGKGSRLGALLLAVPPLLAVVVCLTLTKSRSAYIGLAVGLLVLAWRERTRVRARTLLLAALGALVVVAALWVAGLATRRLDRQVLTESGKSLRYRQEFWIGAWRAINESPRAFWRGFGPGNFQAPYLRHKLPQASEEISDPHNFVLEVWATAGVWAVVALGVAVVVGVGSTLGYRLRFWSWGSESGVAGVGTPPPEPPRAGNPATLQEWSTDPGHPSSAQGPSEPPGSPGWLVACAGAGWVVVLWLGGLDLIRGGDLDRWMILGASWAIGLGLGVNLWRRRPLDPGVLGAAALAVLVNLTAAGGIGIPTVALALWTTIALGLNLREDRPCGRLRGPMGRVPAFALASLWAALVGTLVGQVTPYWKAEAAMGQAEDALSRRPPDLERAEAAYIRARDADKLSARPWIALANIDYEIWRSRAARPDDLRWRKVPIEMLEAVSAPRSPDSWSRHRERARMTNLLIAQLGNRLSPLDATKLRGDVVHASRTAVRLYPTNPALRAWLAEASAEIGMIPDALTEGREALRLDHLIPHAEKKLEPSVRLWLESKLPEWEKGAESALKVEPPKKKS